VMLLEDERRIKQRTTRNRIAHVNRREILKRRPRTTLGVLPFAIVLMLIQLGLFTGFRETAVAVANQNGHHTFEPSPSKRFRVVY